MALLWSLAIPGFGQLYNQDYLVGLVLVMLEFVINVKADLNLAIYYSFRGQFLEVDQVARIQWLLFYPCVYGFSMWHAYNRGAEINRWLGPEEAGVGIPSKTHLNGCLLGFAIGGTLGVIYSFYIGPVLCGLIGGIIGATVGSIFEYLVRLRK